MRLLKVGELAKRAGMTIRTLHHYDEIGLLRPSHRSEAGYRLYGAADVARLTQIRLLQRLGLSLQEVGTLLSQPVQNLRQTLSLVIDRLREQLRLQQKALRELSLMADRIDAGEEMSIEQFTEMLEILNMYEKYFTDEQMQKLEQRKQAVGAERIAQVEAEWPRLIAQVRAELEAGTEPSHPRVIELARRWMGLVEEFTGGDPGLAKSVGKLYQGEPQMRQKTGLDAGLMEYVSKAIAAFRDRR